MHARHAADGRTVTAVRAPKGLPGHLGVADLT
jgi:hypothetical protein